MNCLLNKKFKKNMMDHKFLESIFILCLPAALPTVADAQMTLVKDGKPQASIVICQPTAADSAAATLLNKFIQRMSGATLPVVSQQQAKRNVVLLGQPTSAATEDGYEMEQIFY